MSKEFKSFYKEVKGNEGSKCHYNTRLDTYGCGCQHDCQYCYAKSLLDFRGLWDNHYPAVADIDKIRAKIKRLDRSKVLRLGGMTDCFQPLEKTQRVTYETIKALNEHRQPYLIVTKSDMVADDEYMRILDKDLAHIQITVTCFDDDLYKSLGYEKAPLPSKRIQAIEKLQEAGFDVQLRISPFVPELVDFQKLNDIKCEKILVEFLRINTWIERWFKCIDTSEYTIKHGGYKHLPLGKKIKYLKMFPSGKRISVCEDEDGAYNFWKVCFNPNPNDCCDLRKNNED